LTPAPSRAHRGPAAANVAALREGLALFQRIGAARYARVVPELAPSAIGGHFRHLHDHYVSFLSGLATGRVDYEARERDARFECDLAHARARVEQTIAGLEAMRETDGARVLDVRAEGDWVRSSVARELRFLASHTIHHYALIRLMLAADGVACDASFGVAPSTLEHWRSTACAPSPGSAT
jgi:uncharacterized damage-inducible protein DinB